MVDARTKVFETNSNITHRFGVWGVDDVGVTGNPPTYLERKGSRRDT